MFHFFCKALFIKQLGFGDVVGVLFGIFSALFNLYLIANREDVI